MGEEQSATRDESGAAILAANELFVCRASGEVSHNLRVCADEAGVIAFYDEMFGKDQDGTLDSAIKHLRDEDNWSNACTAYHCELYCATFEVWKVDRSEVASPVSEKQELPEFMKSGALPCPLCGLSAPSATLDFGLIMNRLQRRALALQDNWTDAEARALVIDLASGNTK